MSNNGIIYVYLKYRSCKKLKECKFCNAQLPDEASFCLSCSSSLNCNDEPDSKKPKVFLHKKTFAFCIALLFIFTLSAISAYKIKKLPLKPQTNTPETVLVPVTEENGETVTDSQGDTVYEPVTVETTTKKPTIIGVISNLISGDKDKDKTEETSSPSTQSHETCPTETNPSESKPNEPNSSEANTNEPNPTETEPTTEEEIIKENPEEVFEYEPYNKAGTQISIKKYKGNSSFVTIPDYINGAMVVEIQEDAFLNNSKIKTIDIPKGNRSFIWLRSKCFNNLSSLTTVNLYDNDLGLKGDFAVDCPIKNFNINYWQWKCVNGAIYYYSGKDWRFRHFLGSPSYNTLNLESWCLSIDNDNNLKTAKNLKVINAHKDIGGFPRFHSDYNNSLQAINVETGNDMFLSKDGVLFGKHAYSSDSTSYECYCYPHSKTDKIFTMPQKQGFTFYLEAYKYVNSFNNYLEEIYLPLNAYFSCNSNINTAFPNLKKLHYAKGHPSYDDVRFKFTGITDLY